MCLVDYFKPQLTIDCFTELEQLGTVSSHVTIRSLLSSPSPAVLWGRGVIQRRPPAPPREIAPSHDPAALTARFRRPAISAVHSTGLSLPGDLRRSLCLGLPCTCPGATYHVPPRRLIGHTSARGINSGTDAGVQK
jgi:hypothetical protein